MENVVTRQHELLQVTHVVTHAFRHKGQMLPMGRRLGFLPADTDVLR